MKATPMGRMEARPFLPSFNTILVISKSQKMHA